MKIFGTSTKDLRQTLSTPVFTKSPVALASSFQHEQPESSDSRDG
jgi:hypothetical protein